MSSKKSQQEPGPGDYPESAQQGSGGESEPQGMLPESVGSASSPEPATALGSATTGTEDTAPSPTLTPEGGGIAAVGAWQNSKKISALFGTSHNRNVYAGVEGVGWKKLTNKSDNINLAFTMIAAHAKEKGSVVNSGKKPMAWSTRCTSTERCLPASLGQPWLRTRRDHTALFSNYFYHDNDRRTR